MEKSTLNPEDSFSSLALNTFPPNYSVYTISDKGTLIATRININTKCLELRVEKCDSSVLSSSHASLSSSNSAPITISSAESPRKRGMLTRFRSSDSTSSATSITSASSSLQVPEFAISFEEVHEIRLSDYDPKLVQVLFNGKGDWANNCKILTIRFGNEFNLKTLQLFTIRLHVNNRADHVLEDWVTNLNTLVQQCNAMGYFNKLDMWYSRHIHATIENGSRDSRLKTWKKFLSRFNVNTSSESLQSDFEFLRTNLAADYPGFGIGAVEKEELEILIRYSAHSTRSISAVFQRSFQNWSDQRIEQLDAPTAADMKKHPIFKWYYVIFENYFNYVETFNPKLSPLCSNIDGASKLSRNVIRKFAQQRFRNGGESCLFKESWLCSYYLLDYLYSEDNSIWTPDTAHVYQDMTKPLSHYWISSSHNSYLTGDQYQSDSSVESYTRILRQGCRCIEIDVWNGPLNKPIVTHGRTLTSNIKLKDVLMTIKTYAFVTSPYPVIISIENHCDVKQQKKMAMYFRNIFGKMLITSPIADKVTQLPSPEQLKYRIILKGRKESLVSGSLNSEKRPLEVTTSTDEASPCDLLISGDLWKPDNRGKWIHQSFVLTNKKLFYFENGSDKLEASPTNSIMRSKSSEENLSLRRSTSDSLLNGQLWFHGKMSTDSVRGREAATSILEGNAVNGSFLVRESDTTGGYIISFYYRPKDKSEDDEWPSVHHCMIYSQTEEDNSKIYSIWRSKKEGEMFSSIADLVSYYMKNTMSTAVCRLVSLGSPVPPKVTHEQQEWFYKDMDRKGSEQVLEKLPINGAFLARYGTEDKTEIVISLRLNSIIKHCQIRREGQFLTVSSSKFVTLENLVDHYSKYPFYRDVKLSHRVGKELYNLSQRSDCVKKVYASMEYINSTVKTIKGRYRAIHSHKTDDPELLFFKRGDIISNVTKTSTGWWSGVRLTGMDGETQIAKEFPESFVEEIEELAEDANFGQMLQNGEEWKLGLNTKLKPCREETARKAGIEYYLTFEDKESKKKRKLGASCSKRKALEWVDMINWARSTNTDGNRATLEKVRVAPELSELLVYCCNMQTKLSVPNHGWDRDRLNLCLTKSLDETSGNKLFRSNPQYFLWYHQHALTRIYPKALRLDSSNYNPARFWNFGSQMAALNFQKGDKAMQWNRGKFKQNGNCGYVLKPDFMMPREKVTFDPTMAAEEWKSEKTRLAIQVISGRHFTKSGGGKINPMVEIEVIGVDIDRIKVKTCFEDTGLNPYWNQSHELELHCPQLALIQFSVYDVDMFGDKNLLGESTIPFPCIRQGYRSIQLQNAYGSPIMSSLLVFLEIQNPN